MNHEGIYSWSFLMELVQTIASILTLIGVIWAYLQFSLSKRNANVEVLAELLKETRTLKFKKANNYILESLNVDYPEPTPISKMDPAHRRNIQICSYCYNNIGALLVNKLLTQDDIVYKYIGGNLFETWMALQPHIKAERELRRSPNNKNKPYIEVVPYQYHFGFAANKVLEFHRNKSLSLIYYERESTVELPRQWVLKTAK